MSEICSVRCCPQCDKQLTSCACKRLHVPGRDALCPECTAGLRDEVARLHEFLNNDPEGRSGLIGFHARRLASLSKLLYKIRSGSGVHERHLP